MKASGWNKMPRVRYPKNRLWMALPSRQKVVATVESKTFQAIVQHGAQRLADRRMLGIFKKVSSL